MTFRNFLTELQSIRDYDEKNISNLLQGEIKAFIKNINDGEKKNGFSFKIFEDGKDVFSKLEGIAGYSGVMIKSPHYIGLIVENEKTKTEFLGAYHMQSIVKKLFDMDLGSCWINTREVPREIKDELIGKDKNVNYLLAYGEIHKNLKKQKAKSLKVQSAKSYKTNPYGAEFTTVSKETERLPLGEIAYLYEWGKGASYGELSKRGIGDLFLYIRNAPSYKNMQPTRFIIKDGEALIAVVNPKEKQNITDAGIMLFSVIGMARSMGIPVEWDCKCDEDTDLSDKEYAILSKISL